MKKVISYLTVFLLFTGNLMAQEGARSLEEDELAAYLLVYFKDEDHSLHMAISTDGRSFTDINEGKPVIAGDTIAEQQGIRDPHIYRGPDGNFYLAMTDLHIFAKRYGLRDTEWQRDGDEYGWGNNRGFVLMKSKDLINWSKSNVLLKDQFDGYDEVGAAWAPETIYDPEAKQMMIYFTMRFGTGQTKMYYAYTDDDFTKLVSKPELLFDYPDDKIQVLDADISEVDGQFNMMYVAQEQPGGIKLATSSQVNKNYQYQPEWIDEEPGACEAPNVWKVIGEDRWIVMYDIFSIQPHNFGFLETTDFKNYKDLGHFNEGVMKTTNFSSPKHGAVIRLTRKEAERLSQNWNYRIKFE